MKKLGMWAVVALIAFLVGKSAKPENKPVNDLVVKNVEALASAVESGELVKCYESGKVDCLNEKVAYKLFEPYGLGDNHETE